MIIEVTLKQLLTVLEKAYKEGVKIDPTQSENIDGKAEVEAWNILRWLLSQEDYKPQQL